MRPSHPLLAGYGDRATTRDPSFPAIALSNYVVTASAEDAMCVVVQVAHLLRDDDDGLCWMAADMVEPLIDMHWSEIGAAFEGEARSSAALRKVLSSSTFADAVPRDLDNRLRALAGAAEDTGRPG